MCKQHTSIYENSREKAEKNYKYALLVFFYVSQDRLPNEIKEMIYSYCKDMCRCYACLEAMGLCSLKRLVLVIGLKEDLRKALSDYGTFVESSKKISELETLPGHTFYASPNRGHHKTSKCLPNVPLGHYDAHSFTVSCGKFRVVKITVVNITGQKFELELSNRDCVQDILDELDRMGACTINPVLIFAGKVLDTSRTLESYNLHAPYIHLLNKIRGD